MFNKRLKERIEELEKEVIKQKYLLMSIAVACNLEYHTAQSHDAYYSKKKDTQ